MSIAFRLTILLAVGALAGFAQTPGDLSTQLAELDRLLFEAYNRCDVEAFREFIDADDLEFYHDQSGLTTSADELVTALENNICGKTYRRLEPGTLEVWPLPGYGAVQTGKHRFFQFGRDGAPDTGGTVPGAFPPHLEADGRRLEAEPDRQLLPLKKQERTRARSSWLVYSPPEIT